MSRVQVEAASLLLRDHYGALVGEVGGVLLRARALPLPLIVVRSKLGVSKVKQALRVLIRHHFVEFSSDSSDSRNRHAEYRCFIDRVLLLARYPRYMLVAKKLYGDAAELIVEELLAQGELSLSKCVQKVTKRLEAVGGSAMKAEDVKHQFVSLVETHFLCRCPEVDTREATDDANIPPFRAVTDAYCPPDKVDIYGTENKEGSSAQRKRKLGDRSADGGEPDSAILWRVNFDRFQEHFRDQYLLTIARNRIGQDAEEVLRAALRLNELRTPGAGESAQLSFNEILKLIPDTSNLVKAQVGQYLSLLCDDQSGMIRKVGEAGGGLYVIDFTNAMKAICLSTIQSVIQERYGTKALRIFNLLMAKGYLEQNEIETYAMLPSKEGKELTYSLLSRSIISTKEVPKTNDFAPSRTFYLFHVNFPQVVRMFCDKSYKAVSNVILRRCHENDEHKSLLERQERLEAVTANIRLDNTLSDEMKEQHIGEVEDVYLTSAEKETLEKYRGWIAALQQAENEVDESLLIFNLYAKYARQNQ